MSAQVPKQAQGPVTPIGTREWLALALILSTAVALRILCTPEWFNYDESQHYLVAKSPLFSDFLREFRRRSHPPLNYLLMKPFVTTMPGFLAARMMSITAGALSILVSFFVFRRATRSAAGALAATLLVAYASIFVEQDTVVRGYALMLLFIWLSLLQFQRIGDGRLLPRRDLGLMALVLWLALASEYSAAIHVVALGAAAWLPFLVQDFRLRLWRQASLSMAPYIGPLLFTAAFLTWHMKSSYRVDFGHTHHALYQGSLVDLPAMVSFLYERVLSFANNLAPKPGGIVVLVLAIAPVFSRRLWPNHDRRFGIYCAIALCLMMLASLLGTYPLGSSTRHTIFIVPGILVAALLSVVGILRACVKLPHLRLLVGASLLLAVSFALAKDTSYLHKRSQSAITRSSQTRLLAQYQDSPAAIVVNWRGRTSATQWFSGHAATHLVEKTDQALVFNLDGTTLVQSALRGKNFRGGQHPSFIARWAIRLAREQGRSWIVLSDKSADYLMSERNEILELIAAQPDIHVRIDELDRFARVAQEIRAGESKSYPFGLFSLVIMIESES